MADTPKFVSSGTTAPTQSSQLIRPASGIVQPPPIVLLREPEEDCSPINDGGCIFITLTIPGGATFVEQEIFLPFPCYSVVVAGTNAAVGASTWLSFIPMNKQAGYTDANQIGTENWLQVNGHFLRFCKPFDHCFINVVGNPQSRTICFGRYLEVNVLGGS